MFGCRYKSQHMDGHKQKFVRLDDSSPRMSDKASNRCDDFQIEYLGRGPRTVPESVGRGVLHGSGRLRTIGRSLRTGVSLAVFQEDLKNTSHRIFDPQDALLVRMNRALLISCILAIAVDPMFFYLPVVTENEFNTCIGIDRVLAITTTVVRTVVDVFYLARIALQFRTAYIAPSSRVFGRGELVIDPAQIAHRYMRRFFAADVLSILPLPQVAIWKFLHRPRGTAVLPTKNALVLIVFLQYIPRLIRFWPLSSELKRTTGVFAETAFAGAAYYLLWYLLASHIVGAFWYLLSIERISDCWKDACVKFGACNKIYMYCGNDHQAGFLEWRTMTRQVITEDCSPPDGDNQGFNYGIYMSAVKARVVYSNDLLSKLFFCLWWGLANLSTLGQGLQTSIYTGEALFSIFLATFGLILMALLIGNMQTYLQSLTVRLEEMRLKRRDSEQWMHHRVLPQELRDRVRRYDQFKWLETRGVDEEALVQNLPKDLRRDIKRHLCLGLVRRVPLFANIDERLLDAICDRLRPSLCTEKTHIVREGDPVVEMLFIIRGRLESITTDGGRSGFFNRSLLKDGDFCGEELLTWALDPKAGANLPSSTRTVVALSEVEGFALRAEELKFVSSQFRRLHTKQVQHTFRFYSQQWRTWAASFIQAAWRRYSRRKVAELRRREEEETLDGAGASASSSLRATILVSRFAANALRGVHRQRSQRVKELIVLPKPPEPDFGADD